MIGFKALLERNLLSRIDTKKIKMVYELLIFYVSNSSLEFSIIDILNILLGFKAALEKGIINRGTEGF